ncbi:MAG TPA: hypothetical protein VER79_02950 [Candidatus Limnocylindrales bacterium]|nr:hypothetical protein [Candidatus Limnocylindrales bacterium]
MKSLLRHPAAPDLLIIVCAVALTALYVAVGGGGFALDDAWIHQTYGRNLGLTGVWAFVPGVPSAASTSPLYTILLAAGYALGTSFQVWTHGLGAAALAGTGLLARRLAARAAPELPGVGLAAGLACVFSWHLIWAAASGMETALFGMWTLALILLAWREIDAQRPAPWLRAALFGAVAALTMLTRPEGILLAGLCGGALLLARPGRSVRAMLGWLTIAGAVWLLIMLPYFASNLQLAGGLLPSTNAAKRAEYAVLFELPYWSRLANVIMPLLASAMLLFAPGVLVYTAAQVRALRRARVRWLLLLLPAWAAVLPLLYAAWLPVNYQHGRYVIPIVPALMVAGVVGTGLLLSRLRNQPLGRPLSRALAASAVLVLMGFALALGPSAYQRDVAIINEEMVTPAQWIAANIPVYVPFAAHDIGAAGYFAPRPLLDTAGLVSPDIIPYFGDAAAMWAYLQERGIAFLMAFPDQTPGHSADDPRLCPVFQSPGTTALDSGGQKMTVYALAYEGICSPENLNS